MSDENAKAPEGQPTSAPSSPTVSTPRRRSSLFSNLESIKRPSEHDSTMTRRQSMNDQQPAGGMISRLWNSWVRGPPPSSAGK